MKIVTSTGLGRPLVQLIGRFDAHETPNFRSAVEPLLTADSARLGVDMANVVFLDSAALAELLRLERLTQDGGGELTLINPSDPVWVILEITGFQQVFQVELTQNHGAE